MLKPRNWRKFKSVLHVVFMKTMLAHMKHFYVYIKNARFKIKKNENFSFRNFIIHKVTPVYLHDIINYIHYNSFRYSYLVEIPQVRTTFYGKNLNVFVLKIVGLPSQLVLQKSCFNQFKSQITSLEGESCKCSAYL